MQVYIHKYMFVCLMNLKKNHSKTNIVSATDVQEIKSRV